MSLAPGARLGPYEIVGPLGEGGMGAVYRARDARLGRDVAIKVLHDDRLADAERRQRFTREARVASALSHPNIVSIYDIGTEGDVVYLVMELVDGDPLDRLIPPGGMRLGEVLRIGMQIADACARAHAAGVVHRDLKPANVMLQRDGRARVLDFGLARSFDALESDTLATRTQAGVTSAGMVMGTPAYMSPEQAEGKPLDGRSDIFSFGALLYEMCTGRRAFAGESQAAAMAAVLTHEPAPPADVKPGTPPELSRLIMRCLRKDPARRAQSMGDLRVALEELKEEADSGKLTTPAAAAGVHGSRRPMRLAVGALVVVAALVAAGVAVWRSGAPAPPPAAGAPRPVPLTSYPGAEAWPSFSPDGNQVAFSWNGESQDNFDIYVKLLGPGTPLRVTTNPASDVHPAWSPDGRTIGFVRRLDRTSFTLMVVPALGGPERRLGQFWSQDVITSVLQDLDWTPDGRHLLVVGSTAPDRTNEILRVAVDTGAVASIARPDGQVPLVAGYASLSMSPDGRTLAAVHSASGRMLELLSLSEDFEVTGTRVLEAAGTNVGMVAWSPDAAAIIYSHQVTTPVPLYRIGRDGGQPEALAWTGAGTYAMSVSPAARRLVFDRDFRDTNMWRVPLPPPGAAPDTVRPSLVAPSTFRDVAPSYSRDGRRLVFYSNRSGTTQVWTANADGTGAAELTSMDPFATTGTPRWSPDGQRISFDSNAGGTYQVYVVNADGGPPRALTTGPSANFTASWSPDGRWIYFTSTRSGRSEVWRVSPDGGEPEQVTRGEGIAPLISPDGQWLYYTKDDGRGGLWRRRLDGGDESRVVPSVYRYNFAVTTAGVYWVPNTPNRISAVMFLDPGTGATRQVVRIEKPVDLGLAVSPDDREVIFTQIDYSGLDLMLVEGFQ